MPPLIDPEGEDGLLPSLNKGDDGDDTGETGELSSAVEKFSNCHEARKLGSMAGVVDFEC